MNKPLKITLIVLGAIVAFLLLVFALFYMVESIIYSDFYSRADDEFAIPGLWGQSVPQGFEYIEEMDTFLYTGYAKDGESPSMVYIMPEGGEGKARCVELFEKDGTNFTSHVGGITVYGEYAYIADGKSLAIFELIDILNVDNKATKLDSIEIDFGVAFVEAHGDRLFAGNFYRAQDYETPETHHITTPSGDENTAIIYEYAMNPETGYPVSIVPQRAYSITDAIQGMTVGPNGEIFLSSSWGLTTSHIYVYKTDSAKTGKFTVPVNEIDASFEVPLIYLDSHCLIKDIEAPPMAEEIVYHDGKIYILTEAASMKYLFGKLTGAYNCYAYEYIED